MKKESLTIEQLKLLLLARFDTDKPADARMQKRIQSAFGGKVMEEPPEAAAIKKKIVDWIAETIARRLLVRNRRIVIISIRDLAKFIPEYLDLAERKEGEKFDAKERMILTKIVKGIFKNLLETIFSTISEKKKLYDEYWQWITIVLELAAERHVSPVKLLKRKGTRDEITRRMYTKKQYTAFYKKLLERLLDLNTWKKIVIEPMIDVMCASEGLTAEERAELKQEFDAEAMPELQKALKKLKRLLNVFFKEEIARIYAVA